MTDIDEIKRRIAVRKNNIKTMEQGAAAAEKRACDLRAAMQREYDAVRQLEGHLEAESAAHKKWSGTKSDDVRVSDHAVLRYLERVYGFDTDRIKAEIVGGNASAIRAGAKRIKGATGILVCDNNTVITYIGDQHEKVKNEIEKRGGK